jgi:putative nucleotidyltransferase with HDIG domain
MIVQTRKILLLEEDGERRESLARLIQTLDVEVVQTASWAQGLRLLQDEKKFSLVVAGLAALDGDQLRVLGGLKKSHPWLSIIVLSRRQNPEPGIALLQSGTIDHLAGSDHYLGIFSAVKSELDKKDLREQNAIYLRNLRRLRLDQSKNIKRAMELEEINDSTLQNLMTALDLRDVETFGHSQTVAKYSQVLAKILGIRDPSVLDDIRKGALLHDIGKIAIPDAVLKKPGSLSHDEWEKIRLHPALGFGLVKEIKMVKQVGNIILCHHERYDGKGYPARLKRDGIPLEARIFALADALDAITSHRPYRKVRDFKAAKKEIVGNSRTQFDPQIVDAFCSFKLEKWEKVRFETTSYIPSLEGFSDLVQKIKK